MTKFSPAAAAAAAVAEVSVPILRVATLIRNVRIHLETAMLHAIQFKQP